MIILWMLLLAWMVLILFVIGRALLLRPTQAKNIKLEPETGERAQRYGKRLARMIQQETISSRFDPEREKFFEFHKVLEELFPHVHATCQKHVFDGSLLFKWSGSGRHEPILLMSHQDVVEAGGAWEHAPFRGDIDEEGRVWGRGAVDTKSSLFCIFTAVEELIAEGFCPECDV